MHGDSVTLAELTNDIKEDIDLLLTSSMTNLPAFLALNNPRFAHTPKIMYMHDNQFTRPIPEGETRDMTYCYNTVDQIREKSIVVHPGLDLKYFDNEKDSRKKNDRPVIVWNQRWQFDRNPTMFFRVLNRLNDIDLKFDLILAGDSKHEKPEEFQKAWKLFIVDVTHWFQRLYTIQN